MPKSQILELFVSDRHKSNALYVLLYNHLPPGRDGFVMAVEVEKYVVQREVNTRTRTLQKRGQLIHKHPAYQQFCRVVQACTIFKASHIQHTFNAWHVIFNAW
jgi:hypothetical protein